MVSCSLQKGEQQRTFTNSHSTSTTLWSQPTRPTIEDPSWRWALRKPPALMVAFPNVTSQNLSGPTGWSFQGHLQPLYTASTVLTCFKKTSVISMPKKTKVICLNDDWLAALMSIVTKCFEKLVMTQIISQISNKEIKLKIRWMRVGWWRKKQHTKKGELNQLRKP